MPRSSNPQTALKPQDLVVVTKIALKSSLYTYASLSVELYMSASEIHASLNRAKESMLIIAGEEGPTQVARVALREFMIYGARYAFPPKLGTLVRGMPTAYAAPGLREQLSLSNDPVPVWPYAQGSERGMSLQPLYPSVPKAAAQDNALYQALAMFDAIRIGAVRERELAIDVLNRILV